MANSVSEAAGEGVAAGDGVAPEDDAPSLEGFVRYAIYYAPREEDPLAQLGATWLGGSQDSPDHPNLVSALDPSTLEKITRDARRYGLHGTLKAPFVLAKGLTAQDLDQELKRFAGQRPPVSWSGWRLSEAYGFLSLRPSLPSAALNSLAAGVVAHFARFGAKLSEADLLRRRRFGLSHRQEAYLAAYGYPYVLEDFSFHVTLSGALGDEERRVARQALSPLLAPVLSQKKPEMLDLCLFADPGENRPFRLLRRRPLAHGI